MFTSQGKILQLCPLIDVIYTIFKILYYAFIINTPIIIRGSLVKELCIIFYTFLHFLMRNVNLCLWGIS